MKDIEKLRKAPHMSVRMYMIREIGEKHGISLEYIFGLFDYYNKKNSGRWFWQKAKFTGALKDAFDRFNKMMDELVRSIKKDSEEVAEAKKEGAEDALTDLVEKMERNLELNRDQDKTYISSHIDQNLTALINESLAVFK